MSSSQTISQPNEFGSKIQKAELIAKAPQESTIRGTDSTRVVVTRQTEGELKLRYSPREVKAPDRDSLTAG